MITVKSAKKTLTGNFEINGYCLLEDENLPKILPMVVSYGN